VPCSRFQSDSFLVGVLERGRILLPLLAGYSIIILRGSLLQAMDLVTVFCLLLWLLCTTTAGRSSGPHGEGASGSRLA
jgi:hypothetical protein